MIGLNCKTCYLHLKKKNKSLDKGAPLATFQSIKQTKTFSLISILFLRHSLYNLSKRDDQRKRQSMRRALKMTHMISNIILTFSRPCWYLWYSDLFRSIVFPAILSIAPGVRMFKNQNCAEESFRHLEVWQFNACFTFSISFEILEKVDVWFDQHAARKIVNSYTWTFTSSIISRRLFKYKCQKCNRHILSSICGTLYMIGLNILFNKEFGERRTWLVSSSSKETWTKYSHWSWLGKNFANARVSKQHRKTGSAKKLCIVGYLARCISWLSWLKNSTLPTNMHGAIYRWHCKKEEVVDKCVKILQSENPLFCRNQDFIIVTQ